MKKKKPLPTIREVSDELWKRMEPLILELDPPKETGRPRANGWRYPLVCLDRLDNQAVRDCGDKALQPLLNLLRATLMR